MRWANLIANKAFALGFSWVLGQPVKDTLCGTKAFWREDYLTLDGERAKHGTIDPFGDFDLLLGAARPNISRWTDGWMLFKLLFEASRRTKFV